METKTKKRNLKEVCAGITVNFIKTGFDAETEQTKFVCIINGQSFDFSCGLRACIPNGALEKLGRHFKLSWHWNNESDIFQKIMQGRVKAAKNANNEHVMKIFRAISNLCQPTAYDLLYCLQLDSRAIDTSFEYWCSDFGYDNDSIKALNTYQTCCENAKKLQKALGSALYRELMEAQDEE